MKALKEYDHKSIYSDDVLAEIIDTEDVVEQAKLVISIEEYIKEYLEKDHKGTLSNFKTMLRAYKKMNKEIAESKAQPTEILNNYTDFNCPYIDSDLSSGNWIANNEGVKTFSFWGEVTACYHPILPIKRLKNLETGEEQIEIAYKRNGYWQKKTVLKTVITSASQIIKLSAFGVAVTSENAKNLVKYLSDIENLNDEAIFLQKSTSKLGWMEGGFIPYDEEIVFDGDSRFKSIFDAVHDARGSYQIWLDHMRKLRKTHKKEIKFMIAASFASVLIEKLGVLPFMVDLWGETEGGKTVSLMVAASVWANPDESQYIGDFKTTDVALEAKADMLNNLPLLLDDTSKTSSRIRDNFEGVVYDLCSGKGKSRSNKELGINRENHWKNCIIVNGERPLQSYVSQGGAINRILEIECQEHIYDSPQDTAEILKKNYGHAGRQFVDIIKSMNSEELKSIHRDFCKEFIAQEKMQKQAISLSVILTADKIATDYIFMDGEYITKDEAMATLVDRSEVSDNQRCYEYLLDKIAMNHYKFNADDTNIEKWGIIEDNYAILYNRAFDELISSAGCSKKSFLSWATRKNLVLEQNGQPSKVKKINGKAVRCIWLKLDEPAEFEAVEEEENLPFD